MDWNLIDPKLHDHIDSFVPKRHSEFMKMEKIASEHGFPIIGPDVGYFCYQIARMIKAKKIFELGSGYGYSTAWFAKALHENGGGIVHHTVWEKELSDQAREHLSKLGYLDLVKFHVGEAVEALGKSKGMYDLIFNDIDKEGYPDSLPVIEEKLKPGGVLIIDNMIWGGRIFNPKDKDESTKGVRKFTKMISQSPDWIVTLNPIRDGVILGFRK